MTSYFVDKDYGDDVKEILIGIIIVAPEFDWFSVVRKPRYRFYRKYIKEGTEFIEDRLFSFDYKVDYETFRNQSDEQNKKFLAQEILNSLANLDHLPKKVKSFDKERFKEDLKTFFTHQKLIDN